MSAMPPTPATPPSAVFTYAGCHIAVDPLPATHLQWLREFLTPAFTLDDGNHEAGPGSAGDDLAHRVTLRIDPDRYQRWFKAGADGGEVDAFVLDQGIIRLPTWRHDGPGMVVFDADTKTFYQVTARHTTVLHEVDRPAVRIALMRVIRELVSTHAVRSGALLLHAAAFVIDGQAVIVAGPKRAGKTTLLLQALASGQASYLSNDRVVVSSAAGGSLVRSMPTIVSIRAATLPLLPILAARLERHLYHFRWTLAEVHAASRMPPYDSPRRTLTPAQLHQLMSVDATASAPPELILFPEYIADHGTPELTRLTHNQTIEQINASRFGAPHSGRLSALFGTPAPPNNVATASRQATHRLLSVPAYRYHPATGSSGGVDNLTAILGHLR